jgi:hypothetical protein
LRITVVGSANVDHVARCERLPRPGETVTDAVFERVPGGKGANQALAAARLGAHVRFVGRIGRDDLVLASLEREGVDTSGVVRDDGGTGVALILVDAQGENVIVVAPGANRRLSPSDNRQPRAGDRGRNAQHFAHSGRSARTFIANDQHIARADRTPRDRLHRGLLGIENARRAALRFALDAFHGPHRPTDLQISTFRERILFFPEPSVGEAVETPYFQWATTVVMLV